MFPLLHLLSLKASVFYYRLLIAEGIAKSQSNLFSLFLFLLTLPVVNWMNDNRLLLKESNWNESIDSFALNS